MGGGGEGGVQTYFAEKILERKRKKSSKHTKPWIEVKEADDESPPRCFFGCFRELGGRGVLHGL